MGCYLSAKSESPLPYLHKRKDINVVFIATATVYADLGMGCDFLQCLGQLSLASHRGHKIKY